MSALDKIIDRLASYKISLDKVVLILIAFGGASFGLYSWHADAENSHTELLTEKRYNIEKLDATIGEKQVVKSAIKVEAIREKDPEAKAELEVAQVLLACSIEQDRKVRKCIAADGEDCWALRMDCSP
jgi:hypothetical protein